MTVQAREDDSPDADLAKPALGACRTGNTGCEGVWQFTADTPGPHVMLAALVHGNEPCGAWALRAILQAGLRPQRGVLTLALCNLDAYERFDPRRPDEARFIEEDLNRVWGSGFQQAPTSLERRRATELRPFVEAADWLLDLHSMHEPGPPVVLTGLGDRMIDAALEMALTAMVVRDGGHAEGARMRDHGRFRAPPAGARHGALLIECGAHGEAASRQVALDAAARFLAWTGAVTESGPLDRLRACAPAPPRPPALPSRPQVLEVTDAIVAGHGPLRFAQPWRHGQRLPQAGTLLGWNDGRPFHTPFDGCTLVMPSLRQLRPGVTVMRLARDLAVPAPAFSTRTPGDAPCP